MAKLTSRERVRRTLRHEEPDRIPLTLGADAATTLTVGAYENLKSYLGISGEKKLFSKARPPAACRNRSRRFQDCRGAVDRKSLGSEGAKIRAYTKQRAGISATWMLEK